MALLDCAINKKCCTVEGGRGICPLFSSPPRGNFQLKGPHPREKKMLIPGGQPGGGGAWAQVELTDALFSMKRDQYTTPFNTLFFFFLCLQSIAG